MNVAWGLCWEEAGARNRVFFRVKWLRPAMNRYLVCAAGAAALVESVLSWCSATSGCSCVRSHRVFWTLWLQIALEWLYDWCHVVLPCA